MKFKSILIFLILLLGIAVAYLYAKPNEIMYINTTKVFESFDLKMELETDLHSKEKEFESKLNKIKTQIIGLEQSIKKEDDKHKFTEYNNLRLVYEQKEQEFANQIVEISNNYNTQVWQRLEAYIKEFSKYRNIKILVGNTGDKSVIYSVAEFDVTSDCIEFVNKKYAGFNE